LFNGSHVSVCIWTADVTNCFAGDKFSVGVTPVVYSKSDNAGNRAMCDFKVFIRCKSTTLYQPALHSSHYSVSQCVLIT